MKTWLYVYFLCTLFCILSGCTAEKNEQLIDISEVENIGFAEPWALINEPYAAYRIKPSDTADAASHGRQGDVVKLIGSYIDIRDGQRRLWYQFTAGWLPETAVSLFSNKLQAEFAAKNVQ
ncbi:hypothetical protein [Treponema lecithinolyticum]|uniref:hypothetical protein n=1 Tax=Treponema lecithinolyticum TaxID=53418 RepID=UPI0028EAB6E9|nr:hypothetical protein [Treponema lecithinolyticum]